MTAMRLKRYPSPSGGIALGKMGVGATLLRSKLPTGARWVEYLESTGTQWIGTDFIPDQDSQLELTFENTNTDTTVYNLWPIGAFIGDSNTNTFGIRVTLGDSEIGCYAPPSSARAFYRGTNIGVKFTALFKDKTWSIANVTSGIAEDFQCRAPLPLFAINWANTSSSYDVKGLSIARIYGFKAWSSSVLVRDFRPIAIGTTGYMLDLVSGEYLPYGNKGTGDFTIGPDINAPAI